MWDPIVSSLKVFSFNFDYNLMFPNNPYETCTLVGLVLFLLLYLVFCAPRGIFEFRSCILPCFSKNRT